VRQLVGATDQQQPPDEAKVREVAQAVSEATQPSIARRFGQASILWVDDRPSNNIYERKSLEALGVRFTLSTSTEDALEKVRTTHFDVIISGMGRPPDPRVGYTLGPKTRRRYERPTSFVPVVYFFNSISSAWLSVLPTTSTVCVSALRQAA
jgi:PleD family two-component response regulator